MKKILVFTLAMASAPAIAGTVIPMHLVDTNGIGTRIGEVTVTKSEEGVIFTPSLDTLPPGLHGFHVHENGSCQPSESDGSMTPAGAAGSHFAPEGADRHGTPWGEGHLGDLPALFVNQDGEATQPILAPRLELSDLDDRALMIHAQGDNFSDRPDPLGGGGSRIACGVFEFAEPNQFTTG